MSKRPIADKKLRRLRKAIGRKQLPAYINLLEWLCVRRYADTNGQAKRLLVEGKVKADSHVIGREQVTRVSDAGDNLKFWEARPLVPASLRGSIRVEA